MILLVKATSTLLMSQKFFKIPESIILFQSTTIGPAFARYASIMMKNCRQLTVQEKSFQNILSGRLQISFHNITDLQLKKGSFEMDITRNSHVPYRVNLAIDNSSISEFPKHAFAVTETGSAAPSYNPTLEFLVSNSQIQTIGKEAFGNFTLQGFSIVNSNIGLLAAEAVNNLLTGKVTIINSTITELQQHALILHSSSSNESILLANNTFTGEILCKTPFRFKE